MKRIALFTAVLFVSGAMIASGQTLPTKQPAGKQQAPSTVFGYLFTPKAYDSAPFAANNPVPVNAGYNGAADAEAIPCNGNYGYGAGYDPRLPQGVSPIIPEQPRIVYVPYNCPPPVYLERRGALEQRGTMRAAWGVPGRNSGGNSLGKRISAFLGGTDTSLQEYPEMPQPFYTTRGPRDFLAPNPPGIGE